jgi:hypothetical protein
MHARALIVSTCLFSLCATPALPQAAPATPSALAQAAQSTLPAPANMRAALRAWGLDRPGRGTHFTRGPITDNSAQFSALSFVGSDGKRATLDNLTITRDTSGGAQQGTFTLQAQNFLDADGSRIGAITMTGIRGTGNIVNNLIGFNLGKDDARRAPTRRPEFIQAQSVSLSDITVSEMMDNKPSSVTIGLLELKQATFNNNNFSFDELIMRRGMFDNQEFVTRLSDLTIRGILSDDLDRFLQPGGATKNPVDLMKLALGHFSISDFSFTLKQKGQRPFIPTTFLLARFSIDNLKDGMLGQFAVNGIKITGGEGQGVWEGGLARLNISGLNLAYFGHLGDAIRKGFTLAIPTPKTDAADGRTAPPALTVKPDNEASKRVVLSDILKGGPLDSGMAGFDMAGFKVSAGGYDFTIDQVGLSQVRNANNIVTKIDMIPTTMALRSGVPRASANDPIASLLTMIGRDNLTIKFKGDASFDPATDVMDVPNYDVEMAGIGTIKMKFAMTGFSRMMSQVSFDELLGLSVSMEDGTRATRPTPSAQLQALMAVYHDIKLNSASAEIIDEGGLDIFARITPTRGRLGSAVPTSTPAQIREARLVLANTARNGAGDKTSPPFIRMGALSLARWMENGGSIVLEAKPTTPKAITDLANAGPTLLSDWGVRIKHEMPAQR